MALTKVSYGVITADASSIDLNIDANTLFVDSSANRVGIGTSSPGVHLDIESSTNNAQIEITATDGTDQSYGIFGATGNNSNGAGFYIQDKTASGSPIRFKIDTSGNVGIGTNSPTGTFHVVGSNAMIDTADGSGLTINRPGNSAHLHLFPAYSSVPTIMGQGAGGLHLGYNSNTEGIRIHTNNKVGIGTTSANGLLHIGDSNAEGSSANPAIQVGGGNTYRLGFYTDSEGGIIQNLNGDNGLQFRVKTAGEVMRIMPSGNVGIGTTSPTHQLHIKGPSSAYASMRIESTSTGHGSIINLGDGTDDDYGQIVQFASSAGEGGRMRFTAGGTETLNLRGGKVGIGESIPFGKLHVKSADSGQSAADSSADELVVEGSGDSGIQILSGASNNSTILFGDSGDSAAGRFRYEHDNNALNFGTNGSWNRMYINSSGKVGINTTSPDELLQVELGDIKVEGAANANTRGLIIAHTGQTGNLTMLRQDSTSSRGILETTERNLRISAGSAGGTGTAETLDFFVNGAERMMIDTSGNVGIGDASPSRTLDVTGVIQSKGTVAGGGGMLFMKATNASSADDDPYGRIRSFNSAGTVVAEIRSASEGTGNNQAHWEFRTYDSSSLTNRMRIRSNGTVQVFGALSKGSGSFEIPHPLESKKDSHLLRHSFIEGPQCDNIYRGTVDLVSGTATVDLDAKFTMTNGTFVALNRNVQVFTTNESDWDNVKGSVVGNTLTITCQNSSSNATVSWLVVGERQDDNIKSSTITNNDGKLILEPEVYEGGT